MGLICNEPESTLKDEVINEDKQQTTTNSLARRRRKPSAHRSRNLLYTLFKWYFKSRALQDEYSQSSSSDYEISIENINALGCNDDESSLAYRQHKNPHQIRASLTKASHTPSSSNLSHSHYLVRQSICLYAASSVILALCYLATPSSATTESPSHPVWVCSSERVWFKPSITHASSFVLLFSFSDGKSDKEILDHLLRNSRYDKRLLPPVDGN